MKLNYFRGVVKHLALQNINSAKYMSKIYQEFNHLDYLDIDALADVALSRAFLIIDKYPCLNCNVVFKNDEEPDECHACDAIYEYHHS